MATPNLPRLPVPQAGPVAPAGPRFPLEEVPPVPELPGPGAPPKRPSAIPGGVGLALDAMAGGQNQQLVLAAIRKTVEDYNASFAQWKADENRRLELKYQSAREDRQMAEARNLRRQEAEVSAGQTQEELDIKKAEEARAAALFPEQEKIAVATRRKAEIEANMARDTELAKLGMYNAQQFQAMMSGYQAQMSAVDQYIETLGKGAALKGGAGTGVGAGGAPLVKPGTVTPEVESTDPEFPVMEMLGRELQQHSIAAQDANATPEQRAASQQAAVDTQARIAQLRVDTIARKYGAAQLGVSAAMGGPNPGAYRTAEDFTAAITNAPPEFQPILRGIFASLPDHLTGDPGNIGAALAMASSLGDIAPGAIDAVGAFYVRSSIKYDMAAHPEMSEAQAQERAEEHWSQAVRDNTPTSDLPYVEQIMHDLIPALRKEAGAAPAAAAPAAPAAPAEPAAPPPAGGLLGGAARAGKGAAALVGGTARVITPAVNYLLFGKVPPATLRKGIKDNEAQVAKLEKQKTLTAYETRRLAEHKKLAQKLREHFTKLYPNLSIEE